MLSSCGIDLIYTAANYQKENVKAPKMHTKM